MSGKRKCSATSIYHIPAEAVEGDYVLTPAYVDEVSEDGRRVRRKDHVCYAPLSTISPPAADASHFDDQWTFDYDVREENETSTNDSYVENGNTEPAQRQFLTKASVVRYHSNYRCKLTIISER